MDTQEIRRERLRRLKGRSTQQAFADRSGISKGLLNQILNGHRNMGERKARQVEVTLGLPRMTLDRPLDEETVTALPAPSAAEATLLVPRLEASASMGPGADLPEHDAVIDHMRLSEAWVRTCLPAMSSPRALRVLSAYGDSMSPTFNDGDLLIVDGGIRDVKIDGVYVLRAHERLYVKRVRQRLSGTFEVSSDNPTAGTPDALDGSHQVEVLGRVLGAWNWRRM